MVTKDELLAQRVSIKRKRKIKHPHGWHTDKRKKRKAARKARKGKRH